MDKGRKRAPTGATAGRRDLYAKAAALDRYCARTNAGLAAVALVLALVLMGTAMVRHPESFLPQWDAETGLAADGTGATVMLLGP